MKVLACLALAPCLFSEAARALLGADITTGEVVALDIYENDISFTKTGLEVLAAEVKSLKEEIAKAKAESAESTDSEKDSGSAEPTDSEKTSGSGNNDFVNNLACIDLGRCEYNQKQYLQGNLGQLLDVQICSAKSVLHGSDLPEGFFKFGSNWVGACANAFDGREETAWTLCDPNNDRCKERNTDGDQKMVINIPHGSTVSHISWVNQAPVDPSQTNCINRLKIWTKTSAAADWIPYAHDLYGSCGNVPNVEAFKNGELQPSPLDGIFQLAIEPVITPETFATGHFGLSEVKLFGVNPADGGTGTGSTGR